MLRKSKKNKGYNPRPSLEYCVDYDAQYSEPSNCDCSDYHRCRTFSHGTIKDVYYSSIYYEITRKRSEITSIKDYCLDRWIRRMATKGSFEVYGVNGYYGDESKISVDVVLLRKIEEFVNLLNTASDQKCVEETLILEYGYLLPALENKSWKWKDKVDINSIHSARMDDVTPFNMESLNREVISSYSTKLKSYDILSCMCIKVGNDYRLIDGNHRLAVSREELRKKMKTYKRGRKPVVYMSVLYCEE